MLRPRGTAWPGRPAARPARLADCRPARAPKENLVVHLQQLVGIDLGLLRDLRLRVGNLLALALGVKLPAVERALQPLAAHGAAWGQRDGECREKKKDVSRVGARSQRSLALPPLAPCVGRRTGGEIGAQVGAVGVGAAGLARLCAKDGKVAAQDVHLLDV